jgi:UDP-2,3-diacylglucosamine pyrophosphatase LpxH
MLTLILSDLHLGADNARPLELFEFLDSRQVALADRIILNGDVVDHLDISRYRPQDWQVLNRLALLHRQQRLILVRGNHDVPRRTDPPNTPRSLLPGLLNTTFYEEYPLDVGGRRLLLQHGDTFDRTMNMTTLGDFAEGVYRRIQRWHRPTSSWLKHRSKSLFGVERSVRRAALESAKLRGFDGVILGHTHYSAFDSDDDLWYLNTGSWVDEACSYLVIDGDQVELKFWPTQDRWRGLQMRWAATSREPLLAACA